MRSGLVKEGDREQEDIDQYVTNAGDLLADAGRATSNLGRFLLAYEGIHCIALAVLNHLGARPGDGEGHRSIALQFAVGAMGLDKRHPETLRAVMHAHTMRNQKIYQQPVPPLSKATADAAVSLLKGILPHAHRFVVETDDNDDSPRP